VRVRAALQYHVRTVGGLHFVRTVRSTAASQELANPKKKQSKLYSGEMKEINLSYARMADMANTSGSVGESSICS